MKKSLIALAALAATSAAFAQSSVTLFGVVDLGYENVKTEAGRVSGLAPSANSSSRIGFRGVEDLGGGMSASFHLEAALAPQSGISSSGTNLNNQASTIAAGGLTFNRRSTVSLSGGWGELRLGRDYTPTFWNYALYDPYGANSVGATIGAYTGLVSPTFVRASNSVGYFLPANLGGFFGQFMYAFGNRQSTEVTGRPTALYGAAAACVPASATNTCVDTSGNGTYWGGRLGWAQGPFNVAVSYSRTKYAPGTLAIISGAAGSFFGLGNFSNLPTGTSATMLAGNFTDMSVGGSYQFGPAKVMGYYARQKLADVGFTGTGLFAPLAGGGAGSSITTKAWALGVDWGVGAGDVLASYSRATAEDLRASKWAIGYVHNLSKRTAVYAYYARVTNSDLSAMTAASYSSGALSPVAGVQNVGGTSTGIDIGLRHAF